MLLCLANIGDVMADIFRFVYTNVCCCGCCRKRKSKVQATGNPGRQGATEAWKNEYTAHMSGAKRPVVVEEDDDDDDEDDEKISVPLTITMGVIAGYIFMGSLLFGVWEGWEALQASYFCFVTISTIGFGDVVPGSATFENASAQWKMVGAAVYMLFGMAILSMCFSLIQEEIVAKFRWVGQKIGILEKDEENEEDEGEDDEDDEKNGNKPPSKLQEKNQGDKKRKAVPTMSEVAVKEKQQQDALKWKQTQQAMMAKQRQQQQNTAGKPGQQPLGQGRPGNGPPPPGYHTPGAPHGAPVKRAPGPPPPGQRPPPQGANGSNRPPQHGPPPMKPGPQPGPSGKPGPQGQPPRPVQQGPPPPRQGQPTPGDVRQRPQAQPPKPSD